MKTKKCEQCSALYGRSKYKSGKMESLREFDNRRFCSGICFHKFNSGKNNPRWKRGYRLRPDGYLRLDDDTYLHRKIMEDHLGRKLLPTENIHHIDGNNQNNDITNLEILTNSEHRKLHAKLQPKGWLNGVFQFLKYKQ